ncbi:MAG: HEPN domain-containing protein [Nevskiales bacterium]|nr:HEPN domain-containing protein [Nevskiales bacterium]
MSHWTSAQTSALANVEASLRTVESILSFVKDGQGKPSKGERALFAAAVVFLYGLWENYVEQLAIELVTKVSGQLSPDKVPEIIRKQLEKKGTWELAVHPGWKSLWVENVKRMAIGDDGESFGMNTARAGQVKNLLINAGATDPFENISNDIIPAHLAVSNITEAVNKLVELRGEIVHTGTVPSTLRKHHVKDWKVFVKDLVECLDANCRAQCKTLLR